MAFLTPVFLASLSHASPPRDPFAPGEPPAPGPHALQVAQFGAGRGVLRGAWPPPRQALPPPTPGPDLRVYGYLAYWSDALDTVPWDEITDLAVFSAGADSAGNLTDTANWDIADDAVAMAAPYGVRVHLCVTNFDPSSLDALLSSSTARSRLVASLEDWVADTGADGVNIDFEGLPVSVKAEMVQFTADLDAAVGDVVLATPSVDWAGSWDYDQLTRHADLFVMGYGYHYGGSSYAGPMDPLRAGSGTVWAGVNSYSLTWSVDDYLTWGADPSRVILGLPLYGMSWPTADNGVPTETLGGGSAVVFSSAWAGAAGVLEPDSDALYARSGGEQLWYGDEQTVRDRIAWVRDDTDLAGVGFWALHYDGDDPTFWAGLREETTTSEPTPGTTDPGTTDPGTTDPGPGDTGGPAPADGEWVAKAGQPFLAYVDDKVVLTSEGSRGPRGATLTYEWTQVEGPAVTLDDPSAAAPSFVVAEPGSLAFELRVGDGTDWSEPATSWVVVIDPGLPRRHTGCGCAGGGLGGAIPAAVALLTSRRRRARGTRPG